MPLKRAARQRWEVSVHAERPATARKAHLVKARYCSKSESSKVSRALRPASLSVVRVSDWPGKLLQVGLSRDLLSSKLTWQREAAPTYHGSIRPTGVGATFADAGGSLRDGSPNAGPATTTEAPATAAAPCEGR